MLDHVKQLVVIHVYECLQLLILSHISPFLARIYDSRFGFTRPLESFYESFLLEICLVCDRDLVPLHQLITSFSKKEANYKFLYTVLPPSSRSR